MNKPRIAPTLSPDQRRHARTHTVLVGIAFALFWVPVIIFAKLAGDVAEKEPISADVAVINAVHAGHTTTWDNFFLFMTAVGEPVVIGGAVLLLVAVALYKRWFRAAAVLVVGVGGALAANLILKVIFARTRPSIFNPLVRETSYSFPSGHAMISAAFVCVVMLLLWHTRYRWAAVIGGFAVTLLIGLSRIYLGVHYPSDVLAGWCVGLVWAVLAGSLILNRPFGIGRRLAPLIHRGVERE